MPGSTPNLLQPVTPFARKLVLLTVVLAACAPVSPVACLERSAFADPDRASFPRLTPPTPQSRALSLELTSRFALQLGWIRQPLAFPASAAPQAGPPFLPPAEGLAQDAVFRSLRALRDPSLRPVWAQLASAPVPAFRVHGLLGLAELDPANGIDLLAVSNVKPLPLRDLILLEAIDRDLVPTIALSELSSWQGLSDWTRVTIAATCSANRVSFSRPAVELIAQRGDAESQLAAAAILKTQQLVPSIVQQAERVALPEILRRDASVQIKLARFIQQHRLSAAAQWLATLEKQAKDPDVIFAATLARWSVSGGEPGIIESLKRQFDVLETGTPKREAMALAWLEAARVLEGRFPIELAKLAQLDTNAKTASIGRLLQAWAQQGDVATPGAQLARFGDLTITEALLQVSQRVYFQQATTIRLAIVQHALVQLGEARPAEMQKFAAMQPLVLRAVTAVAEDDPALLQAPLEGALASKNTAGVQLLLQGLLRSTSANAAQVLAAAAPVDGQWPDETSKGLALLTTARHQVAAGLLPQTIDELIAIARGQGSLPPALQAQAAWLALRGLGEDRVALARLLVNLRGTSADNLQGPGAVPAPANP
jgi:hypothetical protein